MRQQVFEAAGISKSFGPVKALQNVSLGIARGEVHAIIGENGAGKSTLMNIFCGHLSPSEGTLRRFGEDVKFADPITSQRASIAIAPQEINIVPELTVAENIVLGAHETRSMGIVTWRRTNAKSQEVMAMIDETVDLKAKAGELAKAQQQLVQIARAVSTNAEILIFDEPTAALTDRESAKLFDFIKAFRERGGSVFYISHRLDEILSISDRISVLRDGQYVTELDPKKTDKDEMVRQMAGQTVDIVREHKKSPEGESKVILSVEGLTRQGEFKDVSFKLHEREILGIAGLVGSGRSEIGRCVFGVTKPDSGEMKLHGAPFRPTHPTEAIERGLVYLPEERKQDGIFDQLSIAENTSFPSHRRFSSILGIRNKDMLEEVKSEIKTAGVKIGTLRDNITTLSGGNQQKVIIARWLMRGADVLFLDEPTRGIDVRAKIDIEKQLFALAQSGMSIIYVSSELQEVIDVSDRILVIHEGQTKGIVDTTGATPETILQMAMR